LKQQLPYDAKIVKESVSGKKVDGGTYQWEIDVKPDEKVKIDVVVKSHLDVKDCM
jgi:hypothetical protein